MPPRDEAPTGSVRAIASGAVSEDGRNRATGATTRQCPPWLAAQPRRRRGYTAASAVSTENVPSAVRPVPQPAWRRPGPGRGQSVVGRTCCNRVAAVTAAAAAPSIAKAPLVAEPLASGAAQARPAAAARAPVVARTAGSQVRATAAAAPAHTTSTASSVSACDDWSATRARQCWPAPTGCRAVPRPPVGRD